MITAYQVLVVCHEAAAQKISQSEARQRKMFYPVYHSTVLDKIYEAGTTDAHTLVVPALYHMADTDHERFAPGQSRWGHDGVYAFNSEALAERFAQRGQWIYEFPGPWIVYDIDDSKNGSFDILRGYTTDTAYLELAKSIASDAGLRNGPPWNLSQDQYGIDYFRKFHILLREELTARGFDGWWMGGELVVWNYEKLKHAHPLYQKGAHKR